ncbi:hypothetical protein ACSTS3_08600 [Aquimarina muelleri]|uniref:hypothetical protein n=1 Tax=Aquimarina muelleri TaxID=279356 RepID=UPI003F688BD9
MKTIKTLFVILFLSTMFIACEAESVNEEVGIEELAVEELVVKDVNYFSGEEEEGEGVTPPAGN